MYCVSRMTEFWGSYGESGGSYIREAKGGSFTGLLPGRIALIELDTERGTYIVTGRDGGIIVMSTVKRNQKASETDFRRSGHRCRNTLRRQECVCAARIGKSAVRCV